MTDSTKATERRLVAALMHPLSKYLLTLLRFLLIIGVALLAMWAFDRWPRATVGTMVMFQLMNVFATLELVHKSMANILNTVVKALDAAMTSTLAELIADAQKTAAPDAKKPGPIVQEPTGGH